jgi:predicted MFS family arabinose efflux permease
MSSFAVASVAGLPIGLLLAGEFGRGTPFVVLAGLSVGVWVAAWLGMPNMLGHLTAKRAGAWDEFREVVRKPAHLWAFAFTFVLVLGTFTVASFIGPYLMALNGWKEQDVAVIYLVAGLGTLVGMNVVGRAADKLGKRPVFLVMAGTAMVLCVVVTNLPKTPLWVAAVMMSLFMIFAAGRMVPAQAMLIGVAAPRLRGSFMSLNTAVQNLSTGLAPMIAGAVVVRDADGTLAGYPVVGIIGASAAAASLALSRFLRPTTETGFATSPVPEPEPVAV